MALISSLECAIAEFLAFRSTSALVPQIASLFCQGDTELASACLSTLEKNGLATCVETVLSDLPPLRVPLFLSGCDDCAAGRALRKHNTPDCGAIAWQALKRFQGLPVTRKQIWLGTLRNCRRFGASAEHRKPHQVWHDLMVLECLIALYRQLPDVLNAWVGERSIKGRFARGSVPDAAIIGKDGEVLLLVEFAGPSYSSKRIATLSADFARYPFQIW